MQKSAIVAAMATTRAAIASPPVVVSVERGDV
jgi:hypothetical protein